MDVFFVCGAPKSGTTWLQRILDAHPEVCCSGEGHFVHRWTEPLAHIARTYNRLLQEEADAVYEGAPVYPPVSQAELDEVARTFIRGRLLARAAPGVRWAGDKTPIYTDQLQSLDRLFPDARFFHILRDPRDVVVSRMGHFLRLGDSDAFNPASASFTKSVQDGVSEWIRAVRLVDAFAHAHPGRVHELRYWELQQEPVETMTRLFRFLGADTRPDLIGEIARATSFEAMSGRKPGQEDPAAFLRKGQTGDWRARLDPEAAEAIAQACAELMRAKGLPGPELRGET